MRPFGFFGSALTVTQMPSSTKVTASARRFNSTNLSVWCILERLHVTCHMQTLFMHINGELCLHMALVFNK